MLAFVNTPISKKEIMSQLKIHMKNDDFVKGTYWENGRGCGVGCTIHSGNHEEYEIRFGIPQMLAHLEDCIFEGLPNAKAKKWPLRFMNAVKEGSDLSTVGWEFQHRLQINNLKFAKEQKFPDDVIKAIELVIDVLEPMTKGKKCDESAAESARSSARSSVRSAAWSAEESAAESARSAALSARSAAESALSARSAAESALSAAESKAREKAYEEMADLLIEIIQQH